MTRREYIERSKKLANDERMWEKEKDLIERENALKDQRRALRRKSGFSTTKAAMVFLFANCTVVEVYSMVAMIMLTDLSALYSLITAVVGEAVTFAAYSIKATKENSVGGITFETAMRDYTSPVESETPAADEEVVG